MTGSQPSMRAADGAAGPKDLRDFLGTWRLERQIEDRRAGTVAQALGQAELRADGAGALYEERITLYLAGQSPIEGRRRYLWRRAGPMIAVFFEDGRAFHDIPLGEARPAAAHWCDPDQYDVRYDFSDWPQWSSRWEVAGPRKDYAMRTQYAPLPAPAGAQGAA